MSDNRQLTPAAYSETGSQAFGANDFFANMPLVDDSFNFTFGNDTLGSGSFASGNPLDNYDYVNDKFFDSSPIDGSFFDTISVNDSSCNNGSASDSFLDISSTSDNFGNNQSSNSFVNWDSFITGDRTGDEVQDLSSPHAEQLNSGDPEPSANVPNHYFSLAELQTPSGGVTNVAFEESSAFQVPSSASADQALTSDNALPMEKQQQLLDFLSTSQRTAFDSKVSPYTQQHASSNDASFSCDAETVVEQLQSVANNSYQKIGQQLPQSNVAFGAGKFQHHGQVHSAAGAKVNMSPKQFEDFKRHLAREVQKPGMTKQDKMKVLTSVPGHLMDAIGRAHPMSPAQRQASVPQVPAQVPQQTAASYQQYAAPTRKPAKQTQRPSRQPRASGPRSRRPAPLAQAMPTFKEMTAQQCIDLVSPTPSASTDGGNGLSGYNYRPEITHAQPPMDPNNPPAYPAYFGHFKTGGQASRFRKRVRIPPKAAKDLERVKKYGRQFWVQEIYTAMIDCRKVIDTEKSTNRTRLETLFWDPLDLEAAAHNIFDGAVNVHARGFIHPAIYHKRTVRGKLIDTTLSSVEMRMSKICNLLRTSKAVVDDCMRGGITLALVVDNPTAREATKVSNNAGNTKRGTKLAHIKRIEKKQGRPLSEAQMAKVIEQFGPDSDPETPEDNEDSVDVEKSA